MVCSKCSAGVSSSVVGQGGDSAWPVQVRWTMATSPPAGRLYDDLVLRQRPSDHSQVHAMQHVTRAQLAQQLRSEALGLLLLRAQVEERIGEVIVTRPCHAATIERNARICLLCR